MRTPSISNVTYHKFSHGAASCMLNGENVAMLELSYLTLYAVFIVSFPTLYLRQDEEMDCVNS